MARRSVDNSPSRLSCTRVICVNILRIFAHDKGYFRTFRYENICYRSDSIPQSSERAFKLPSYVTNVSNVTLRRDLLVVQRANVR